VPAEEVREILAAKFAEIFERELVPRPETIKLVKILVHDNDRVLLLHRRAERGNFWQPVTGSIEEGELPLETARRELVEETGHAGDPRPLDLQQSFLIESAYLASKYDGPIIASEVNFASSLDSRLPIKLDPEEHDGHGWFTFAEAYEKIRWTDDREALERLESLRVIPSEVEGSPARAEDGRSLDFARDDTLSLT
jgi:lipoyl(octanoyl) transferase